jgi:hypothetical protein
MNWFHLIRIIAWGRCGAYTRAMSGRYIVVAAVSLFCAFALLYVAKISWLRYRCRNRQVCFWSGSRWTFEICVYGWAIAKITARPTRSPQADKQRTHFRLHA